MSERFFLGALVLAVGVAVLNFYPLLIFWVLYKQEMIVPEEGLLIIFLPGRKWIRKG